MIKLVVIKLNDGFGQVRELGFVMVEDGCCYSDVRQEIRQDGLLDDDEDFVFLGDRELPFTSRQEGRFHVTSDEVTIKSIVGHIEKRQRTTSTDLTCENQHPETVDNVVVEDQSLHEEGKHVIVVNDEEDATKLDSSKNKLLSKLAMKGHVAKWKLGVEKLTVKLRTNNQKDRFELCSRDVNGKAEFSLWCVECDTKYGKGGDDTLYNFERSHLKSKLHMENYERNMKHEPQLEEKANESNDMDICAQNRILVESCLASDVTKFKEETGVSFKLYENTLGGYASIGDIRIICLTCNKLLELFPKTGSLNQHMKDHILSNRHVRAIMEAERKETNDFAKGGRPKKSTQLDPRQGNLLTFFTKATLPSTTDDCSSSGVTRKGKQKIV